jgi:hypothetical protein
VGREPPLPQQVVQETGTGLVGLRVHAGVNRAPARR